MFFYVSKIAWFILQPSSAMLILLLIGILLLWSRWAYVGRYIVLCAGILLAVTGLSPLGHALILPLEERFPRPELAKLSAVDGVIVLGGAQDMSVTAKRGAITLNEAGERLVEAAILARRYPDAKILLSGGSNALFGDRISEAMGAGDLLAKLGVEKERIVLEDKSRNTSENARYSARLAHPTSNSTWLLLTSAAHMPRAMGVFRAAGFQVMAYPVDYRTRGRQDLKRFFPKPSEGWRRVDQAVREWAGLTVYRFTGRTQSLFPAPK